MAGIQLIQTQRSREMLFHQRLGLYRGRALTGDKIVFIGRQLGEIGGPSSPS